MAGYVANGEGGCEHPCLCTIMEPKGSAYVAHNVEQVYQPAPGGSLTILAEVCTT